VSSSFHTFLNFLILYLKAKYYDFRKYHTAKKRNIPIVTPRWIEECMAYWKKVDKSKFVLQLTTEYEYAMNKGLSHMNRLSRDDLSRMQDEVDEELAGMTSEEDDDNDLDEPEKKKQKV
jgi:hypothetical protein